MDIVKTVATDDWFREFEVIKCSNFESGYGLVINKTKLLPGFGTEYSIRRLRIFKFWLIRKIQLWAIKKAFR